jgi:GTP cyclohydrolase I
MAKVSRKQVTDAITILLSWMGEDPKREGLASTPERVTNFFEKFFSGYSIDPKALIAKTYKEISGYHAPIILKNITLHSFCEHHMLPMIGIVHIAYIPNKRVVGISKLTQMVNALSKRLQIQENLNAQIADTIQEILKPKGVAVFIEAKHYCMILQEENTGNCTMNTSHFTGVLKTDSTLKKQIIKQLLL